MLRIPTQGPPTHPGEMLLEEFLLPLGIPQSDLARLISVPYSRINELVHGRRSMTTDMALRLERLLGMEAQFWLNLQLVWNIYYAQNSPTPQKITQINGCLLWPRRNERATIRH